MARQLAQAEAQEGGGGARLLLPWLLPKDVTTFRYSGLERDLLGMLKVQNKNRWITVFPFSASVRRWALNAIFSFVRMGRGRSYLVATLDAFSLAECLQLRLPCYDASRVLQEVDDHVAAFQRTQATTTSADGGSSSSSSSSGTSGSGRSPGDRVVGQQAAHDAVLRHMRKLKRPSPVPGAAASATARARQSRRLHAEALAPESGHDDWLLQAVADIGQAAGGDAGVAGQTKEMPTQHLPAGVAEVHQVGSQPHTNAAMTATITAQGMAADMQPASSPAPDHSTATRKQRSGTGAMLRGRLSTTDLDEPLLEKGEDGTDATHPWPESDSAGLDWESDSWLPSQPDTASLAADLPAYLASALQASSSMQPHASAATAAAAAAAAKSGSGTGAEAHTSGSTGMLDSVLAGGVHISQRGRQTAGATDAEGEDDWHPSAAMEVAQPEGHHSLLDAAMGEVASAGRSLLGGGTSDLGDAGAGRSGHGRRTAVAVGAGNSDVRGRGRGADDHTAAGTSSSSRPAPDTVPTSTANIGSHAYLRIGWAKVLLLRQILQLGYHVHISDVDVTYLREAYRSFNILLLRYRADAVFMKENVVTLEDPDNPLSPPHKVNLLNTGVYFMRSNNLTLQLVEDWTSFIGPGMVLGVSDQVCLNLMAFTHYVACSGSTACLAARVAGWPTVFRHPQQFGTQVCPGTFNEPCDPMRLYVHAVCTSGWGLEEGGKASWWMKYKLWLIRDDDQPVWRDPQATLTAQEKRMEQRKGPRPVHPFLPCKGPAWVPAQSRQGAQQEADGSLA